MVEVITPHHDRQRPAEIRRRSVIVFGGGLAGIAASARLAQADLDVTLIEARSTLGGRTFSFRDAQSGRVLDNGQHVIVGACRNLIEFLETIGARRLWHIQSQLDVAVYDRTRRLGRLYGVSAPAPLHLLPAFLSYPHLSWTDKAKATRGLIAMMQVKRGDLALEDITFHDWLISRGQSDRVISNLWNVLIEGTLNDHVREVSAAMGLMIVQDGLLAGRHMANVGYPTAPLSQALTQPAQAYLNTLGVDTIVGAAVRSVHTDADCVVRGITLANGGEMLADAYVSALPFWTLRNLFAGKMANTKTVRDLSELQTSPIVNVHLLFDRPVMSREFCYFLDSPLQWVFNSTRIFGGTPSGNEQALSVSVSAAWDYIDMDRSGFAQTVVDEMAHALPETREAALLESVVVKQRNATFRCTPGANRRRPGPHTESPNLFLAGEWTDTGWPSTMEGAIISGYNAADAVISSTAVPIHSEHYSVG